MIFHECCLPVLSDSISIFAPSFMRLSTLLPGRSIASPIPLSTCKALGLSIAALATSFNMFQPQGMTCDIGSMSDSEENISRGGNTIRLLGFAQKGPDFRFKFRKSNHGKLGQIRVLSEWKLRNTSQSTANQGPIQNATCRHCRHCRPSTSRHSVVTLSV